MPALEVSNLAICRSFLLNVETLSVFGGAPDQSFVAQLSLFLPHDSRSSYKGLDWLQTRYVL